jgi:O-antigen/teichoic acid export membrane protein
MSFAAGADGVSADALSNERRSADWDFASAPRNYTSLVAAQVLNAALAFAAIWIVTRLVGKTGYGTLVAMLAAGQCVGQLAVQWSAPSLVRFGCEEFVETGRVAAAFWTRLKVLAAAFAAIAATSPLWFPVLAGVLHLPASARLPVILFVITTGFWVHVQYALQSAKLLRLQARILIVERSAVIAGLAIVALTGDARPGTLVFVYVATPLVASLAGVWVLRHLLAPHASSAPSRLGEMLRFSLPLVPASIVGYFSTNYFDAFFITYYLSTSELGHYTLVFQIAGMAMQLPLLAGSVALPLFITLKVTGDVARLRQYFGDVLPLATLVWSTACAAGAAAAELLVPIVFGAEFSEPGSLIWPLMTAAAFSGPVLIGYMPLANAQSRPHANMIGAIVMGGTNLVLNVLWIPRWGLAGCAWATAASYAAALVAWMAVIDDRPIAGRWSVIEATLPVATGAVVYGAGAGLPFACLSVAMATGLVALVERTHLAAGIAALRAHA